MIKLSKISLEERLNQVNSRITHELKESISNPEFRNIPSPYHKYELVDRIVRYFINHNITFGENGYEQSRAYLSNTNKEPLKGIERGQRLKNIPKEFIESLDDFEKIYFFSGIDKLKNQKQNIEPMTAYEIASIYIRAGIDNSAYLHNSILEQNEHKRKVTRGKRKETYSNAWTPPHSKEIRKRLLTQNEITDRIESRNQQLITNYETFFSEEKTLKEKLSKLKDKTTPLYTAINDRLYDVSERLCIMLDGATKEEKQILSRVYGPKEMGCFYTK